MARSDDFAAMTLGSKFNTKDLTQDGPLMGAGATGRWIECPAGGRVGAISIELDNTAGATASVALEYAINQNAPLRLWVSASSDLQAPGTATAPTPPFNAYPWVRLVRLDSGLGGITGEVAWG